MSRQKFFTKAAVFICSICAVYFAASCFLGASEAAGRKSRHRAKLDSECSIAGYVLDYKEKTEIANAKLQARFFGGKQKLLTEYSEDDGYYCFMDMKPGKYTMTVKKSGYNNNVKNMQYKGKPLSMNIYLKCKLSGGCVDTSGGSSGGGSGGSSGGSTSGGTSGGTTGGTTGGSTSGGTTGGSTGGTTGGSTDTTAPTTTASPGGTFTSAKSVALTCKDTGGSGCAATYYTTDGTTPTTASTVYTGAITISSTTTLKYFSMDNAENQETVKTQTYTISSTTTTDTTAPTTTAAPAGSTFTSAQSVTLTCADNSGGSGCYKTFYTTNGTAPTTASSVYSAAISISATTTLKFFSVDKSGNFESVKTETYTISTATTDTTAPATTASPAGSSFTSTQSVTLTCTDNTGGSGCSKTYYTTDSSTPSTLSTVYTTPITISSTTTLKYFSVDTAGNQETVKTETYTISLPVDASKVFEIKFDNSMANTGSNGDTLTASGTTTYGTNKTGMANKAFSFDGATRLSSSSAVAPLTGVLPFSISMWIYFNSLTGYQTAVATCGFKVEKGFNFGKTSGNNIALSMTEGSAWSFATGSTTIAANTWYHIIATWDGTTGANGMKVYVSSASDNTATPDGQGTASSTAYTPTTFNMSIGDVAGNVNHEYVNGKIDQFRVYNRVLSASERSALYTDSEL